MFRRETYLRPISSSIATEAGSRGTVADDHGQLGYILMAGAGDARYEYTPYATELSQWAKKFPLPSRMLPVYTSGTPSITDIWWGTQWNEATKTLVLSLGPMVTSGS